MIELVKLSRYFSLIKDGCLAVFPNASVPSRSTLMRLSKILLQKEAAFLVFRFHSVLKTVLAMSLRTELPSLLSFLALTLFSCVVVYILSIFFLTDFRTRFSSFCNCHFFFNCLFFSNFQYSFFQRFGSTSEKSRLVDLLYPIWTMAVVAAEGQLMACKIHHFKSCFCNPSLCVFFGCYSCSCRLTSCQLTSSRLTSCSPISVYWNDNPDVIEPAMLSLDSTLLDDTQQSTSTHMRSVVDWIIFFLFQHLFFSLSDSSNQAPAKFPLLIPRRSSPRINNILADQQRQADMFQQLILPCQQLILQCPQLILQCQQLILQCPQQQIQSMDLQLSTSQSSYSSSPQPAAFTIAATAIINVYDGGPASQ